MRPRMLASTLREPTWRTIPPISSGSTVRGRLDLPAGALLDLADDRARLLVGELVGGGQLDGQLAFLGGGHPLELLGDLRDLPGAALLDQQAQEVEDERIGLARDRVDGGGLRALVELRVAEQLAELGHLPLGLDEVAEVAADGGHAPGLLRRLEQRARVGAVDDAQTVSFSSTEKSRSPIASSISLRWSSRSSTLPVTFAVATRVSSATSARI